MQHDQALRYSQQFTTALPERWGGRHLALFLDWAIRRGLTNPDLSACADALRAGTTNALDLLFDACGGELSDVHFSDEGNAFIETVYLRDYVPRYVAAIGCSPTSNADEIYARDPTPAQRTAIIWNLDRYYARWLRRASLLRPATVLEQCVHRLGPVIEKAGFPRVEATMSGTNLACASFGRENGSTALSINLVACNDPESLQGLQVLLRVFDRPLNLAVCAERQLDGIPGSYTQEVAGIPVRRLAEGWTGAVQEFNRTREGFWTFREPEVDPLLDWLANRLATFALPALRGLDSLEGLALAYGARPMSASPIHLAFDPYPAIVVLEKARHPRLGSLLDEMEQGILAMAPTERRPLLRGALMLIDRVRQRSPHLL